MQQRKQSKSILNDRYEILDQLGDGQTAVVYLANDLVEKKQVALKIIRGTYLKDSRKAAESIQREVQIMKELNHSGCIKLLDEGTDGIVIKASGRCLDNLTFLVMEYVKGETLFDFQETLNDGNGMGESAGRFIMN